MGWHPRVHSLQYISGKEIRMRAFKVFIFGLLYGWVLKIAFDRIYHQNEMEDIRNENASLKEYIHSLVTQLESKSVQRIDLQTEPKAAVAPAPVPAASASEKNDLKVIKGIGPAIEKKLNNAGIHTYAALSRLTVEELENILGGTKRLVQDEGSLIRQAIKLAVKK
jgi:predicted flap endonuclease-1-like 5' DNA nuclease